MKKPSERWVVWIENEERQCGYERICITFAKDTGEDIARGLEHMWGSDVFLILPEGRKPRRKP